MILMCANAEEDSETSDCIQSPACMAGYIKISSFGIDVTLALTRLAQVLSASAYRTGESLVSAVLTHQIRRRHQGGNVVVADGTAQ